MQWNPELKDEIRLYYTAVQETCDMILTARPKLTAPPNVSASSSADPTRPASTTETTMRPLTMEPTTERLYAAHQRTYSINKALAILLNSILQVYEPTDHILQAEHRAISRDIIDMAIEASVWKPLGGSWALVALVHAWGATTDATNRRYFEKIHRENWTEILPQPLSVLAAAVRASFERLRCMAAVQAEMQHLGRFEDAQVWIDS